MDLRRRVLLLKSVVWALCLIPVGRLILRFFEDQFGADPVLTLTHWSGHSALVLLLGALAVTPARRLTGWNDLQRVRRLVGLFAFAYACFHFVVWIALDRQFMWPFVVEDLTERPFVIAGASALACLVPLAVTSTKGWIRRLGKRWRQLHRLVYAAAVFAVTHFYWGLKADFFWPAVAAVVLGLLFVLRLPYFKGLRRRRA